MRVKLQSIISLIMGMFLIAVVSISKVGAKGSNPPTPSPSPSCSPATCQETNTGTCGYAQGGTNLLCLDYNPSNRINCSYSCACRFTQVSLNGSSKRTNRAPKYQEMTASCYGRSDGDTCSYTLYGVCEGKHP